MHRKESGTRCSVCLQEVHRLEDWIGRPDDWTTVLRCCEWRFGGMFVCPNSHDTPNCRYENCRIYNGMNCLLSVSIIEALITQAPPRLGFTSSQCQSGPASKCPNASWLFSTSTYVHSRHWIFRSLNSHLLSNGILCVDIRLYFAQIQFSLCSQHILLPFQIP